MEQVTAEKNSEDICYWLLLILTLTVIEDILTDQLIYCILDYNLVKIASHNMYLCTRYIALLIEAAHASRDQIQCRHVLQL